MVQLKTDQRQLRAHLRWQRAEPGKVRTIGINRATGSKRNFKKTVCEMLWHKS